MQVGLDWLWGTSIWRQAGVKYAHHTWQESIAYWSLPPSDLFFFDVDTKPLYLQRVWSTWPNAQGSAAQYVIQRHNLLEAAHGDDFCGLSGKLNPNKYTCLLREYKGRYILGEKDANNILNRGLVYLVHKESPKFNCETNHSTRKCKKIKTRNGEMVHQRGCAGNQ